MAIHRSLLFAPGNHARRVAKALALDADAVILDLEDACPIAEKKATRALVVAACQHSRRSLGYVRVNATTTEFGLGDIMAVIAQGVDGIVLPKVESAEEIRAVDWVISGLEQERGLPAGRFDVIPIIETGKGMANIHAIAAAPRIRRIAFGAGDLTLDLNIEWSRGETELLAYRSACVLASRAAGIEAPLDTVWVDLSDTEGFRASARHAKRLGFQGKMCIHPDQVPEVNAIFSPSAAEVEWSRKVVQAFAAAEAAGSASIQLEGKFIDYPIVYRARRVLETIERIARGERPAQSKQRTPSP
ncbi:MAG: CoA ester lyase [Hyphomicrobiaceae bacterium]|nr:CoA ester lyase [Hyphomicrobiaceae bacterium]